MQDEVPAQRGLFPTADRTPPTGRLTVTPGISCVSDDTLPRVTTRAQGRRPWGTGSLVEASSGVWRLRVYAGRDPITGHPRQVRRTVRGTQAAAQAALGKLQQEVVFGRHRGTAASLGKLLDDWLSHPERIDKAKSTTTTYRQYVERRIRPALGDVRLDRLTAHDLDRFYGGLQDEGLAVDTIRLHHAIVSGALTQAVRWGWLDVNPAKFVTVGQRDRSQKAALSAADVQALVAGAEAAEDPELVVLVFLAALTAAAAASCGGCVGRTSTGNGACSGSLGLGCPRSAGST